MAEKDVVRAEFGTTNISDLFQLLEMAKRMNDIVSLEWSKQGIRISFPDQSKILYIDIFLRPHACETSLMAGALPQSSFESSDEDESDAASSQSRTTKAPKPAKMRKGKRAVGEVSGISDDDRDGVVAVPRKKTKTKAARSRKRRQAADLETLQTTVNRTGQQQVQDTQYDFYKFYGSDDEKIVVGIDLGTLYNILVLAQRKDRIVIQLLAKIEGGLPGELRLYSESAIASNSSNIRLVELRDNEYSAFDVPHFRVSHRVRMPSKTFNETLKTINKAIHASDISLFIVPAESSESGKEELHISASGIGETTERIYTTPMRYNTCATSTRVDADDEQDTVAPQRYSYAIRCLMQFCRLSTCSSFVTIDMTNDESLNGLLQVKFDIPDLASATMYLASRFKE